MMIWRRRHGGHLKRLSAYIDGELAGRDRKALEGHLASCEYCSRRLRELRAQVAALQGLPQLEPRRSFLLTPQQVAQKPVPPAPTAPALSLAIRLSGAALALALAVVLVLDLGGAVNGGQRESTTALRSMDATEKALAPADSAAGAAAPSPAATPPGQESGVPAFGAAETPAPESATSRPAGRPEPSPPQTSAAPTPAASARQSGGGVDALRVAEIALAIAVGTVLAGNVALVIARRKR